MVGVVVVDVEQGISSVVVISDGSSIKGKRGYLVSGGPVTLCGSAPAVQQEKFTVQELKAD